MAFESPTKVINSSAIVWFLLTLSTMIILAMGGSWAAQMSARATITDQRVNTLEQQFGTVVAQLQDLREASKRQDDKLDKIIERQGVPRYVK